MKIKDILTESVEEEDMYNPEASTYAETTQEYYKQYFAEFLQFGTTPVFTSESNFHDPDATEWDIKPEDDQRQSAGYRGQQDALVKAGVPHDSDVDDYINVVKN